MKMKKMPNREYAHVPHHAHNHIRQPKSDRIFYAIVYTVITLLTISVLDPLIYVVSASLSSAAAINSGRMWLWPVDIDFIGYKYVLKYKYVWVGYRNTIFYTLTHAFLGICMCLICAYPLARRGLRFKGCLTFLFTFTMLFSGGMIPGYLLMKNLRLLDTVWAIIIPGSLSVYNMIVTRTFIQSNIPEELLEAARIDGCSDAKFFFKMVLPLSKTIIAVLALMYASAMWNSYFSAFLYLKTKDLYPLQIFLRQILVQANFDSEMLDPDALEQMQNLQQILKYAIIVVSTAPMVLFYPFVQKYFEKGVMIGSLKG